jgi:hypothetical protein
MTRYIYLIDDHIGIVGTPSASKLVAALAARKVRVLTPFGLIPVTLRHCLWFKRMFEKMETGFHPFVYPDGESYYLTKTIKECKKAARRRLGCWLSFT